MNDNQPTTGGGASPAVIYTRFSPRREADMCQSCAWQQAECEQYAANHGMRIERIYNDPDVSGADALRPALWDAINALRKGDVLLVWKWDRLARDLILALQIERAVEQRGARVVATCGDIPGSDPQAQFTRHILMAVAELERKMIKQRTSAAMKALQRSGRRMSKRVPYGWRPDPDNPKRMLEDESEKEIISTIRRLRESGMGFRPISDELDRRGIKSRCGSRFDHKLVMKICSRFEN